MGGFSVHEFGLPRLGMCVDIVCTQSFRCFADLPALRRPTKIRQIRLMHETCLHTAGCDLHLQLGSQGIWRTEG